VFENGRIKRMIAAFKERAPDGLLQFDDFFEKVFPTLFSDPEESSTAEILNNKFFLKVLKHLFCLFILFCLESNLHPCRDASR